MEKTNFPTYPGMSDGRGASQMAKRDRVRNLREDGGLRFLAV